MANETTNPTPKPTPTPDGGAPDDMPEPDTRNYGRSEPLGTDYAPTEAQSGTQTPPEADTDVNAMQIEQAFADLYSTLIRWHLALKWGVA